MNEMAEDILVSIITPSFNSARTIGKTIRAICEQAYTHLQYFIIDGGSIDDTVKIAERYRNELEQKGIEYTVISEPDHGIYDAMNKGIRLASGEIIGIINSDD